MTNKVQIAVTVDDLERLTKALELTIASLRQDDERERLCYRELLRRISLTNTIHEEVYKVGSVSDVFEEFEDYEEDETHTRQDDLEKDFKDAEDESDEGDLRYK